MASKVKSKVVKGPQLSLLPASASERHEILVRLPIELWGRFNIARAMEKELLQEPYEPAASANAVVVRLVADYVARWDSINASEDAKSAAKVLRKGARRG